MDPPAVNVLSLCAGAGGLDLGVRMAVPAARTVCYVEVEAFGRIFVLAQFVEALMGWPIGWTACDSSGTASSPTRQPSPSAPSARLSWLLGSFVR